MVAPVSFEVLLFVNYESNSTSKHKLIHTTINNKAPPLVQPNMNIVNIAGTTAIHSLWLKCGKGGLPIL